MIAHRLTALLCAIVLATAGSAVANQPTAKQAIGQFERCASDERQCVRILKRNFLGQGIVEVKAQIRNGRIYWYRYNKRSGELVRLN